MSSEGISPDPKKLEAIQKMKFPEDKETMHSFLGLVNYLNRYSNLLASYCSTLRELVPKDVQYKPTAHHYEAFNWIKSIFKEKTVLPYFSSSKETILQVDASKKGFGACLLQLKSGSSETGSEFEPVYFASRTLSKAEKNYENLERECMAAVWGMEKFHYYLYGS